MSSVETASPGNANTALGLRTWSGTSRGQLLRRLAQRPAGDPITAQTPGRHRIAIVVGAGNDPRTVIGRLAKRLTDSDPRRLRLPSGGYYAGPEPTGASRGTAFLFPGQGSQHVGMLAGLRQAWAPLERALKRLDAAVGAPLSELIAAPGHGDDDQRERRLIDLDGGAQIGFIVELELHRLLGRLGIECDAMLGHSNGEHAALVASATFRLAGTEARYDVARQLMQVSHRLPPPRDPERCLAVSNGDRTLVGELLATYPDDLFLATDNCPHQLVLAGRAAAVDAAARCLEESGAFVLHLPFERAFHTPLFGAWQRELHAVYQRTAIGTAERPLYSCATVAPYPTDSVAVPRLAAQQWSETVRFGATVERLYGDGVRCFIEVGPGQTLTGFVDDTLRGKPHLAVSTCSRRRGDLEQLHHLAAELWVNGYEVDLAALGDLAAGRLDADPAGSSEVEPAVFKAKTPAARGRFLADHLALMDDFAAVQERSFTRFAAALQARSPARKKAPGELRLTLAAHPYLRDHCLGRQVSPRRADLHPLPVLAFTQSLELAGRLARDAAGGGVVTAITDVRASRWLALDRGELRLAVETRVEEPAGEDGLMRGVAVQLFELAGGRRLLAFEARVELADHSRPFPARHVFDEPPPPSGGAGDVESFYRDFAFHGPLFQSLAAVRGLSGEKLTADLRTTGMCRALRRATAMEPVLDPALLDGVAQLVGWWLLANGRRDFGIFPYRLSALRIADSAPEVGTELSAQGKVRWQERGATVADFELRLADGAALYRIEGLEQRFLGLPAAVGRRLVAAGEPPPVTRSVDVTRADARIGPDVVSRRLELDPAWLAGSWGVWGRALAHLTLDGDELDAWYSRGTTPDVDWLCGRLAAKEAICAWALEHRGLELSPAEVAVSGPAEGILTAAGGRLESAGAPPKVRLERTTDGVIAHAAARPEIPAVARPPQQPSAA